MASHPLTFEPDSKKGEKYHQELKNKNLKPAVYNTYLDRKCILFDKQMSLPPVSELNSNNDIVNLFTTILSQEFARLPVAVYPVEHFEILYKNNFAVLNGSSNDYVEFFYKHFKKNDLALLQKDILLFPFNYGYAWHLVAIDKPVNAIVEGQICNVYFLSGHQIIPQYSLANQFTKYLEMAFTALGHTVFPANFRYQELILEEYAYQGQILCCVYTELAYKISEHGKDMSVFFSGIKPIAQCMKFEHRIFERFLQTIINCFAVEHNKHGQIPVFEILTLEDEDLSWIEKTDFDRILNPLRQMRVVRPLRKFAAKNSEQAAGRKLFVPEARDEADPEKAKGPDDAKNKAGPSTSSG